MRKQRKSTMNRFGNCVLSSFLKIIVMCSITANLWKHGWIVRCHAFASSGNRQYHQCARVLRGRYVEPHRRISQANFWSFRGGGDQLFPRNQSLHSTTSPLKESSHSIRENEIEKKALESLPIVSGGISPVSLKSFGGLTYRDSLSSDSSCFRVVFILGGPGAGKGTQCDLLIQNYPCHHLSAGQLLRDEAEKKDGSSEHAALIADCLVAGKIVPVEISLSLLQNAMSKVEGNDSLIFLIDGFPRNFDNLEGWTRCMTRDDKNSNSNLGSAAAVWGVLSYDCPLSILEDRVMQRSKDSGRSDDNLESLRRRFETFQTETVPVVETLKVIDEKTESLLKVVEIEGQRSLDEVWEETQKSMNSFIANDVISSNSKLLKAVVEKNFDTYRGLCADEMFSKQDESGSDGLSIMEAQEEGNGECFLDIETSCAEISFISGKKVSISYDRTTESGKSLRETRIWSHQGPKGWRMVHFYRREEEK